MIQSPFANMILVTSVHDPYCGLMWLSDQHITKLKNIFDQVIIVSSPFTDTQYLKKLKQQGCIVKKRKDNRIGTTYFKTIEEGAKHKPDWLLYCDFDRILHWIHNYKNELTTLVKEKKTYDYAVLQRTAKGYKQHHQALYDTEQLPNKIISKSMEEKTKRDYLSGSFLYNKKVLKIIIDHGGFDDLAFFGEWPVLLKEKGIKITYKKMNGLSWETPNQHREAVKDAGGVKKWREQLSSKEEWRKRTIMANEFVRTLV